MKVEVSLYASSLKNVAGMFKGTSDPFAVVTQLAAQPGEKPQVLGKTEVVKNTLNPKWVKTFTVDYEMGTPVKLAISLFDEVRKGDNKSMGTAVFDVEECLGAKGNTKVKKLRPGGNLFCSVRKSQGSGLLRLTLKGVNLKNVEGFFSKSDPFFELSSKVDSAGFLTWNNVFRSKHIKNNLNPQWETAVVELSSLCGGNLDAPILVSVFDHEGSGKHVSMGQFETTVNGLVEAGRTGSAFTLTTKGKGVGSIVVVKADVSGVQDVTRAMAQVSVASTNVVPMPSAPPGQPDFVDYVSGGCELNVTFAIDFTGSNGDPRKPGTLHYLGGGRNDYEKAIAAILSVLAKYDSDQNFPVYGFGAKYNGVVNHCFQCGSKPEAKGVQGVLDAYRQVFGSGLIMSSPTVFMEVINVAAQRAREQQAHAARRGGQAYSILLIITDGAVSDVQATAACLDRASDAPISIVIVGVGTADFSAMKFLDDAASPGKRDITQFVEFNKHCQCSAALTAETLHEIPDQLVGYFQSHGIAPLPLLQRTESKFLVEAEEEEEEIDLTLDVSEEDIVITSGGDGFVDGFNATR